jgi:phosphoenolpyruvate carboxylase
MGTDIEDPSGENVHDMKENNIFEYRSDPTMEVGVIAVGVTTINMSSLQPLSKLSLALTSHSNRK